MSNNKQPSSRNRTPQSSGDRSRSAQDQAYRHVKTKILSLVLKPGQWIKAQDIATQLAISRTPVREALSRLEQEGFVRRDQGWGYIVESITFDQARELYKVREVLEAEAVRDAVGRVTSRHLNELDALLDKAEAACMNGSITGFRTHARAFHASIAEFSANKLLMRMLSQLQDQVQVVGAMVFEQYPGRMREVLRENRAILSAMRSQHPVAAEKAARHHVREAWKTYLQCVIGSALTQDLGLEQVPDTNPRVVQRAPLRLETKKQPIELAKGRREKPHSKDRKLLAGDNKLSDRNPRDET